MKRLKYIFTVLCLLGALCASGALPQWEHVTPQARQSYETEDSEKIEVTVHDGYIYITTNKAVTVKVMSIVGQLISQQNVQAGTSRLKVSARGIYILKAGAFTIRVTV